MFVVVDTLDTDFIQTRSTEPGFQLLDGGLVALLRIRVCNLLQEFVGPVLKEWGADVGN